jgi:hypothetical protein
MFFQDLLMGLKERGHVRFLVRVANMNARIMLGKPTASLTIDVENHRGHMEMRKDKLGITSETTPTGMEDHVLGILHGQVEQVIKSTHGD